MEINFEEAKALQEWILLRVGYISYEHDAGVHKFIDRLFEYIKYEEEKNKDDSAETSERGLSRVDRTWTPTGNQVWNPTDR